MKHHVGNQRRIARAADLPGARRGYRVVAAEQDVDWREADVYSGVVLGGVDAGGHGHTAEQQRSRGEAAPVSHASI